MKRFALALLLLGCSAAPAPTPPPAAPVAPAAQGAPGAIQAEGVPPIPKGLTDRLLQYQSARSASFEDFGPDGSILISTRFAETAQLHRVPFPGGRREQLTFTEEPVAGGVFVPGTQDILYSQGRGGDENWQIHRLDRKAGRSTLLTDGKSRYGMGPISRKGDRMVISSTRRNGKDTDLYLLDLKTGTTEILLETKAEFWVATDWSPDDSRLALLRIVSVNESHLAVMDLKSREKKGVVEPGGGKVAHGAPRFSRDGRLLAFASDARGEFKEIAIVDLETRKTEWSKQSWDVTDVEISGEQMAFVTNEDGASRLTIARDGADTDERPPPAGEGADDVRLQAASAGQLADLREADRLDLSQVTHVIERGAQQRRRPARRDAVPAGLVRIIDVDVLDAGRRPDPSECFDAGERMETEIGPALTLGIPQQALAGCREGHPHGLVLGMGEGSRPRQPVDRALMHRDVEVDLEAEGFEKLPGLDLLGFSLPRPRSIRVARIEIAPARPRYHREARGRSRAPQQRRFRLGIGTRRGIQAAHRIRERVVYGHACDLGHPHEMLP